MPAIKLRMTGEPRQDDRDLWHMPSSRRRIGYEGGEMRDSLWTTPDSATMNPPHPAGVRSFERGYGESRPHPVNREDMMMRMKELDEERAHLEHAMKSMESSIPMMDDMNPELVEKLESVFGEAVAIASDPPETWNKYIEKEDYAGIVGMESKELVDALKQKKLPKEVKKELTHTLAAILRAGVR